MKLHLIGLPHTAITQSGYEQCAFTRKLRDFPAMMAPFGHEVILYASDRNETPAELVTCITTAQQEYFLSEYPWFREGKYYKIPFADDLPIWRFFIKNVVRELKKRVSQGDLILISSPIYYKPLEREFPNVKIIEYGVGYPTVISPYRVFESEAWRNYIYGSNAIPDHQYGNDVVIPNYYEEKRFPYVAEKEDYLLFMARPIPAKGWAWVQILAAQGHKIKVAGAQEMSGPNIEWVGYVEGEEKAKLMGKAKALLSPTNYLEPFGGVVAEAALCGTPAITTDWGCYKETVEHGKTGFRAKNFTEFSQYVQKLHELKPRYIERRARALWSTEFVGRQYDEYLRKMA